MANYGNPMPVARTSVDYGTPVAVGSFNYGSPTPVIETGWYRGSPMGIYETGFDYARMIIAFTGCFPKTELIATRNKGYVPIGDIQKGEFVQTFNPTTKCNEYTKVTQIHTYRVNEIVLLNESLQISASHPVLVLERESQNELEVQKWKVAMDILVGDSVFAGNGKLIDIHSKEVIWHESRIEVLNISTENKLPFIMQTFVVRSENAVDNIITSDSHLTKRLLGVV